MNDLVEEGKAKAAGVVSVLIGICALIELICGFIYLSKGGPEGSGVWSGVGLAIITILGILTWLKRNKAVMVFYLVMCILWFIVMIVQVIIALIAWFIWHIIRKVVESNCHQSGDICICDDTESAPITVHNCDDIRTIEACFLAILIVGGFAAVFTLAGSIIGCMGTCCARSSQPGNVVVVAQPGVYPMAVQQTAFTTQQGYPPQQQGYPPQHQGYPPQQQGYPPLQQGYPPQHQGYPGKPEPAEDGPPPEYGMAEKQ